MADEIKNLAVLGCTGSIGRQTLEVVRAFPERFRVVGLAGGSNTEFITRLAGAYEWQISETSRFTQALSTEIGGDSVITRSSSAITAAIATSLAMKFAVNIKHQSDVPIGRKKTDTESSLTLVYSF